VGDPGEDVTGPFVVTDGGIRLSVGTDEQGVLRSVPTLLQSGDDAGGRLDYTPHPDDPVADAEYRELVGDNLAHLRREDRESFNDLVAGEPGTPENLEAFMRVIGEVRLVLAGRLGIEDDGWEAEADMQSDPELALLGWLGYLQDAAVGVLSELF
jgi:hypothetical protein